MLAGDAFLEGNDIRFLKTVDSSEAGPGSLTVISNDLIEDAGSIEFLESVGTNQALFDLALGGSGILFGGNQVITDGEQVYGGPVAVAGDGEFGVFDFTAGDTISMNAPLTTAGRPVSLQGAGATVSGVTTLGGDLFVETGGGFYGLWPNRPSPRGRREVAAT